MNEKIKYWDDFINPVLVKEIRQFFHNKFLLSLVGGLLCIQLLILFIFNLTFSEWKDSTEAGTIFIVIDTILMYLCVLVAAIFKPMVRFMEERSSKELDFSNITLLTPWQIIGGKLASSLVIWGLIAAVCLPFMVMAYFFRNVTLEEIMLIFGAGIMPMLVLIQASLFCGTLGSKWMIAVFLYFAFQVVSPALIFSLGLNDTHGSNLIFWIAQGAWLMLFALLLAATIAMVTPPFANRMLPLRILLCLMLLPVLAALPFTVNQPEAVHTVLSFTALALVGTSAFLAVCDRDEPGGRVLAQIPRNAAGKLFHFLFSSNRRGGIVLALIILLIFGAETVILGSSGRKDMLPVAFGIAGFILFYCELAILLNRFLRVIPGWIMAGLVAFTIGVLPLICTANSHIELSDIFTSPAFLLQDGMRSITEFAVWIGPGAAWVLGICFVVDMCTKYKYYKAPELRTAQRCENSSEAADEKAPL